MARPNPVRSIMEAPLPSLTYQRRKLFRPSNADITYAYNILNRHVFANQLRQPEITQSSIRDAWGECRWMTTEQSTGTWCTIRLMDKWFCPQWFVQTLAHEMVHQWQWDVYRWDHREYYGREMYLGGGAHGPSFFLWRDRFEYYGLNLRTYHRQKKWFKYQDFSKC
jgi:SprT-like family